MARLGTVVQRWTRTHTRAGGGSVRTDIALNKDGKLLRKISWLNEADRLDHTGGWKLVGARHINDDQIPAIHRRLTEKGFIEVEV